MSEHIASLHPREVWQHFERLTQIPRVSGNEAGVRRYLQDFAAAQQLPCSIDAAGNVIISHPCAEARSTIILQAHMDMVGVCTADLNFDFAHNAIRPYIADGYVRAMGTTLGADNGIGMAMILALLADPALRHLALRAIFTVEEETTMRGARSLAPSALEADYLINLDSEENGCLYVSCAGSENCEITLELTPATVPQGHIAIDLELSALTGGHSGVDIHKGRGNAIILLAKLLRHLQWPYFLGEWSGGTVRNAIPSCARARIAVQATRSAILPETLNRIFAGYRALHAATDPDMHFQALPRPLAPGEVFYAPQAAARLSALLVTLPQGPLRMSDLDPRITQTSLNLGVIRTLPGQVRLSLMYRSLHPAGLDDVQQRLLALQEICEGLQLKFTGRCPCWQSPPDSQLVQVLCARHRALTGQELQITAMHAGLECAFFVQHNPRLQIASLGPDILSPHSPQERVDIRGVAEVYQTVRSALAELG